MYRSFALLFDVQPHILLRYGLSVACVFNTCAGLVYGEDEDFGDIDVWRACSCPDDFFCDVFADD